MQLNSQPTYCVLVLSGYTATGFYHLQYIISVHFMVTYTASDGAQWK